MFSELVRERLKPKEQCQTGKKKHQISIIRLETRVKKEEKVAKLEKYQHNEKNGYRIAGILTVEKAF